ncbi:hypothetical protein I350_00703 [Cryptococcus amylolentus CBS 6273]|uniref:Protein kinase regulator n=1 Tax=Cryptococcus amylolentus CBS 6273 TaxID=1296118 RepID=A0A1E3KFR1_9TREE|nr:hypothetical protein I350_00703 [Cryptococcus amylolentus CBS 6273]
MAVTSPKSASPPMSLLDWDENAVVSYLDSLGLGQYDKAIHEQGITGDVLAALDLETLQNLGISSVGHRLALLRAVYELKEDQGIEIGEEEWRPQEVEEQKRQDTERLVDMVREQHERLSLIERDHERLKAILEEKGISIRYGEYDDRDTLSGADSKKLAGLGLGRSESLKWREMKQNGEYGPNTSKPRPDQLFPTSLASSSNFNAPLSSHSTTFQDNFTPTTTNTSSYNVESPTPQGMERKDSRPSTVSRLISETAGAGSGSTATSPGTTPPGMSQSLSASSSKQSSTLAPTSSSSLPNAGPSPNLSVVPSDKEKSRAKDDARKAAKSFRVTLEDPCWKVLPAALKKYKINDDWRLYALFICYDNTGESTERCLSYDEKPLLLFQKLKETGHKPVFMLRHIKDIKSPVFVAHTKQAQKLGLPGSTTASLLPKIKPATDTSVSPIKSTTLKPAIARIEDGHTPNGAAFPELPSPGLRDGDGSQSAGGSRTTNGQLIDPDGNTVNVTYGVAIYPYCRDREDEFDVPVGSSYIIRSKSKGWYIVNRDIDGTGSPHSFDQGWVPAGCILELSQPVSLISPSPDGQISAFPGLLPIPPSNITSSSYAGFALMDYKAKSDDELALEEGEKVRVYKKYCHWSYVIRNDTGERGWVPAWFVGKTPNTISTSLRDADVSAKAKVPATSTSLSGGSVDGEGGDEKTADESK